MTARILYLFPDTNLFEQGRALDQIDWTSLGDFDEVELIVVRPVQAEIDKHKNQGNSRLAGRARAASTMLREIILSPEKHKVIRDALPRVRLLIRQELRPDTKLNERLDYQSNDDQLVGTVAAFIRDNPDVEARLLTHDTGPMASADMVGVPFLPVPDEWLLPPEKSSDEKELLRVNTELARLKKAEPEFHLLAIDVEQKEIKQIEVEHRFYDALSPSDIDRLMESISQQNPISYDFGSREPQEGPSLQRLLGIIEKFTPASDEEINTYKTVTYPAWVEKCRNFLAHCHILHFVDPLPSFCFVARNDGTRPAKDALVEIGARGDFKIRPDEQEDEELPEDKKSQHSISLPQPPRAPRGTWSKKQIGYTSAFDVFGGQGLAAATRLPITDIARIADFRPKSRDPNAFYWKPKKSYEPVSAFGFECEQWRHAGNPETFHGKICIEQSDQRIKGALAFKVRAENMSSVAELVLPVRITIARASVADLAQALVDRLNRSKFRGLSMPPKKEGM